MGEIELELLKMEHIDKSFFGIKVLNDVVFDELKALKAQVK